MPTTTLEYKHEKNTKNYAVYAPPTAEACGSVYLKPSIAGTPPVASIKVVVETPDE